MDTIIKNVPYLFISKEFNIGAGFGIFNLFALVPVEHNEGFDTIQITKPPGESIIFSATVIQGGNLNTPINVEGVENYFVVYKIPLTVDLTNPTGSGIWDGNDVLLEFNDTDNFEFTFEVTAGRNTHRTSIFAKNIFQGHPTTTNGGKMALDAPYVYLRRKQQELNSDAINTISIDVYKPRILVPTNGQLIKDPIYTKSIGSNGNSEALVLMDCSNAPSLNIINPDLINSSASDFFDAAKVEGGFSAVVFKGATTDEVTALKDFDFKNQGNTLNYYMERKLIDDYNGLPNVALKTTQKKEVKVSTRSADTFPNNIFAD